MILNSFVKIISATVTPRAANAQKQRGGHPTAAAPALIRDATPDYFLTNFPTSLDPVSVSALMI